TSATANLSETNAVLSTGGTLSLTDLDATAATVVAQTGTAGSYGSFVINSAGVWTYTTSSALNNLNAGQTASESFTVATTDGGSATVTVNITGSEDVSTLTSATANLSETNAVLSTGGTLSLTDLDATAATVV
ncbi:VCBS domain-containing protein, partial [Neisseria gonorrhoeae]